MKKQMLKDTVDFMLSDDYQKRFIAEYWQLKIRYEKLKAYNTKIECSNAFGTEEPPHVCPYRLLREQQKQMGELLHTLEVRANLEHISLDSIFEE